MVVEPSEATAVPAYPGMWQWAAVSTQLRATSVPPQMNLSPWKRAACQGSSHDVPSITHSTEREAAGTKGHRVSTLGDPKTFSWTSWNHQNLHLDLPETPGPSRYPKTIPETPWRCLQTFS